jgi:CCR4-NOT transcription complex subunit 7/8
MGQQLPRGDEETHEIVRTLQRHRHGTRPLIEDTEFPGIIATRCELDQRYYSEQECEYFLVKRNVEETKMIQIGLSIADEDGNVPHPVCTWQFNFRFDKDKDRIVDQSYDLLIKAGVRFDRLVSEGIDYSLFAEYFAGSGTDVMRQDWC